MLTVYTIAYNESVLIKFMIDHYRSRFPNCRIVVYDNESTDDTVSIAKENGCEVITYSTNNKISDKKYLEIKNNCWKDAATDWVLICDMDELLDITAEDLVKEDSTGKTAIRAEAYNMVNLEDNYDLASIKYGSRCEPYDKTYCFNRRYLSEINYAPGCHTCQPVGPLKFSDKVYPLYHYICIHPELQVAKYKLYSTRLSEENIKNGWGSHYFQSAEQVKAAFYLARTYVKKIRD